MTGKRIDLKILPEYYKEIRLHRKTFEIRKDDRDLLNDRAKMEYRTTGTGIIKVRRDGSAMNVEQITCDRIIGEFYDKGKWVKTNKAAIHHRKKGSHLVPIKGNNYD